MSKLQRDNSTNELKKLLKEVIEEPAQWHDNNDFIEALKVQGKLAKWQDDERKIVPCSLNTLKTSAEKVLSGGYERLEELRIGALDAIEGHLAKESGPKKGTKAALQMQIDELKKKNSILQRQNTVLVDIVCNLKENAAKYAKKAPALIRAQCEKDMRGVEARINFSANEELLEAAQALLEKELSHEHE